MNHLCHAKYCTKKVPPKLFMCKFHWNIVPPHLQRLIWKHYQKGQEVDKTPTEMYLTVTDYAEWYVKGFEDGFHKGDSGGFS